MSERPATAILKRDRPLVLYDLLDEIAALKAEEGGPAEVDRLTEEFRRDMAGVQCPGRSGR